MTKLRQQFVIVGLSGGVDSSVSALLLKNQGYHVEALFMQNWQEQNNDNCCVAEDLHDAEIVCDVLKIKLHKANFSNEYWQKVFNHFLEEYAAGRTPNPDVLCNKEIKFGAFLNYAQSLGADFIATGHYAQHLAQNGEEMLLKGADKNKDQSYFLYLLDQKQLATTLFPVGGLTKQQVRTIAQTSHLPNYAKKDSTGICFIGERKFKNFLSEYLLARPGNIITTDKKIVGKHEGLMFYTIGQRQGIGVGGQKDRSEAPWYVAFKDQKNNTLVITQNKNHPNLMAKKLICTKVHWISGRPCDLPLKCRAKIRYRQLNQDCIISATNENSNLLVEFSDYQWAITPGQSVVFYNQEQCLGGGIIADLQ